MAETYGTETHEHEEEYGEHPHEQDAVNEAPSDYEFSDDSGATADVEHNEEILSSEEKSPRRSPVMPIIAVVGGVLILGGVAWWQFGNHSPVSLPFVGSMPGSIATVPPPVVPSERKPGPPAVKVTEADHTPPLAVDPRVASATPQMQITDQSSAAALPNGTVAPARNDVPATPLAPSSLTPAPAPSVLPAAVPVVTVATVPAVVVQSPYAMPAPPPQHAAVAPAAPSPSPPSLAAQPVVPAPVATTTVAVPAAADAADKAQIDALNQHINELQAKLDHVNEQLSQVMNMVAATANASHASAAAQDQASKVAPEVSTIHKMPIRPPSPARYAAMTTQATPEESPSEQGAVTEPAQTHHTTKHKRTHINPTHKPVEAAETPQAQESAHHQAWVLRAATPGHAWVATSADSRDLKAIQVGDAVPGIGQVTGIHQQGTSWVVQGTHGTIR